MMKRLITFSEFLKETRAEKGLSQLQMSFECDISQAQYCNLEKGTIPKVDYMIRILNNLGYELAVVEKADS